MRLMVRVLCFLAVLAVPLLTSAPTHAETVSVTLLVVEDAEPVTDTPLIVHTSVGPLEAATDAEGIARFVIRESSFRVEIRQQLTSMVEVSMGPVTILELND